MGCCVVIPVYKDSMSPCERASLRQCIGILGSHPIVLVCPEHLDTSEYNEAAGRILDRRCFAQEYFAGVEGYNRLLLSHFFYAGFSSYEYMLIYQLDAWVFEDRLHYWCAKNYDYIGAPWFYRHRSHEEGERLWLVGNGGLSLRRIQRFAEMTGEGTIVRFSFCHVFSGDMRRVSDILRYIRRVVRLNGKTFRAVVEASRKPWEDLVFCQELRGTDVQLNVPPVNEAALFSIEVSPRYVFEEVNKGRLPFGCHAWKRYQYEDFWKEHILF